MSFGKIGPELDSARIERLYPMADGWLSQSDYTAVHYGSPRGPRVVKVPRLAQMAPEPKAEVFELIVKDESDEPTEELGEQVAA